MVCGGILVRVEGFALVGLEFSWSRIIIGKVPVRWARDERKPWQPRPGS